MRLSNYIKLSFHKKIIVFYIILLCMATISVGLTGYYIAKDALNKRGEIVLENGVMQAIELIDAKYQLVEAGVLEEAVAKEEIKVVLSGPLLADGTRDLNREVNLGEHGYFIIYDEEGNEIMHPTLEGVNVWDVKDFSDEERFIVREQIDIGRNGGGFMYYSWLLPHSDKIGEKISYGNYDERWGWIVVATAYQMDFNSETDDILMAILILTIILIVMISFVITKYIEDVTRPIIDITTGMAEVAQGEYRPLITETSGDEIELLLEGYNNMVISLSTAQEELKDKNERMEFLAYHDEMTGLPNRFGLKAHIESRIKDGANLGYLVQADIVGLQAINSTLGYEQGNKLLNLIGGYFANHKDSRYRVGRTLSNEFAIWAETIGLEEVKELIYEVRLEIKAFIEKSGYNQGIDMHISIAIYPTQGTNFDELYEECMMAMKLAKDKGDLSITVYEPDMKLTIENEILMRKYLKGALEHKEIIAYYQAKVDYVTKEVVGVEALARWNSKELGFVSPGVFIPAITKLNLMGPFSDYMLRMVLQEYPKLIEKYNEQISVSINISPSYFMDRNFYERIKSIIDDYDVPAHKIILEITEDVFITDYEAVSAIIDQLHNLGIRIAIDDFGTGYSSLNYLTNMNFDEMKIDKSFIDQILSDEKVFHLFEILCNIAQVYGYDIVAEGVETTLQLDKISSTPLRVIQGYLFSKPEPID